MTGQRHVPVLKPPESPEGLPAGVKVALLIGVTLAPWVGIIAAGGRPPAWSGGVFVAPLAPLLVFLRLWPNWPSSPRQRWSLLGGSGAFLVIVAAAGFVMALFVDRADPPLQQVACLFLIAFVEVGGLFVLCLLWKKLLRRAGVAGD